MPRSLTVSQIFKVIPLIKYELLGSEEEMGPIDKIQHLAMLIESCQADDQETIQSSEYCVIL